MARKPLNLTAEQLKEHKKKLHTLNARKRRKKEQVRVYKRLVGAVLELKVGKDLSIEQTALELAENGQFRLKYTPKVPSRAEKPKKYV